MNNTYFVENRQLIMITSFMAKRSYTPERQKYPQPGGVKIFVYESIFRFKQEHVVVQLAISLTHI